jgi:hypothetical protein
MKFVLLLTGTVKPANMVMTKLTDAGIRQQQYIDALNFWLTKTDLPIVFTENSDTDLSPYFKGPVGSGRLEILTFKDVAISGQLGKGFGEMNCMLYAHTHSRILKEADFVFKMTGRLKLLNFRSFYTYVVTKKPDVAADLANRLDYADSRFWGYKPWFLNRYLAGLQSSLSDLQGVYFEHILARSIIKAIKEGVSFAAFDTRPRMEGMSGTSSKRYNSSPGLWYVRNIVKRIKHKLLIKSLKQI